MTGTLLRQLLLIVVLGSTCISDIDVKAKICTWELHLFGASKVISGTRVDLAEQ